jgi:hypothetical protein
MSEFQMTDQVLKPTARLQGEWRNPPASTDVNEVARAWGEKLIEVAERASIDEEFRKEIAKRIR